MSLYKRGSRDRLVKYKRGFDILVKFLERESYICPYSDTPDCLAESDKLFDENGNKPKFCTLIAKKDEFTGEDWADCTGAIDGRSCWAHFCELHNLKPIKYKKKSKRNRVTWLDII